MKHKMWGEVLHARDISSDTDTDKHKDTEEEEDDEKADERRRVKRNNIVHTAFLVATSFACGVVTTQRGPSILDLGDVTHSSLQSTVSLFAIGALGQMIGCVGAGLVLGRLHSSMFLFWILVGMCGSTVALPWCASYGTMAGVYCISLACVGCVETGSYAEIAKRWGSDGFKVVQLLQLWFVVGGVVSPAVTQFFLAPRNLHHNTSVNYDPSVIDSDGTAVSPSNRNTDFTSASRSILESASDPHSRNESLTNVASDETNSSVQIAYIISGMLSFLVSIPFLVSFLLRKKQPQSPRQKRDAPVPSYLQVRDTQMSLMFLVALFFFLVSAVEDSMHQFLFTFLIHEAHWSARMAAWVTSWFWCGVLLVRLVAYFVPDQVSEEATLALSCAALPCTLAGLHASIIFTNTDGVWACVFFAGMSISLIFSVSFTWLHTNLAQRSSTVTATVMSSTSVAGIVNPLVLGYFLHNKRYTGFTFFLLAEAFLGLLVFVVLHVLSQRMTAAWHNVYVRKSIHVEPGRLEEVQDSDDSEDP